MHVLLDTNLLLRAATPDHAQHQLAVDAISTLQSTGHEVVIVPQVCCEYYVVPTRPTEQNGLGLDASSAIEDLDDILKLFRLMRDERAIFPTWKTLVQSWKIHGKRAHDARLVAAMLRHGIEFMLTFNAADFKVFPDVTTLEPASVVNGTV